MCPSIALPNSTAKPQAEPSLVPWPTPSKAIALPLLPAGSIQQGARRDQDWTPDHCGPSAGSKSVEPSFSVFPLSGPSGYSRLKLKVKTQSSPWSSALGLCIFLGSGLQLGKNLVPELGSWSPLVRQLCVGSFFSRLPHSPD